MDMEKLKEDLARPFPVSAISWRIGSTDQKSQAKKTGDKFAKPTRGIPLAFIDARDVMQRLDAVCGIDGWQCRYPLADSGLLICEIGIFMNSQWIWKSNGAGDTQVEAEKGKASDAFKRAAVLWGIGRYLYALPNQWVPLGEYNKFEPPTLPHWATPAGYDEIMAERKGK